MEGRVNVDRGYVGAESRTYSNPMYNLCNRCAILPVVEINIYEGDNYSNPTKLYDKWRDRCGEGGMWNQKQRRRRKKKLFVLKKLKKNKNLKFQK